MLLIYSDCLGIYLLWVYLKEFEILFFIPINKKVTRLKKYTLRIVHFYESKFNKNS